MSWPGNGQGLEFNWTKGLLQWLSKLRICLQCRRCSRLGFDPWVRKILWRKKWKTTLEFLSEEFHGQRGLANYSPKCHKESDTTQQLSMYTCWDFKSESLTSGQFTMPWHQATSRILTGGSLCWDEGIPSLWGVCVDMCLQLLSGQVSQDLLLPGHGQSSPLWLQSHLHSQKSIPK